MNFYLRLIAKLLLVTAAFALLLIVVVTATTVIFQSHIHPDDWTTTNWDIASMVFLAVAYVIVMARMLYRFSKSREKAGT